MLLVATVIGTGFALGLITHLCQRFAEKWNKE